MLRECVKSALEKAAYKKLEDETWFVEEILKQAENCKEIGRMTGGIINNPTSFRSQSTK